MQLRSTLGLAPPSVPAAPPVIVRTQIRPPKLALLPAAGTTRNGLLASTFLHHGHPHSIGMATDIASRTRYDQGPRGGRSDARVRL